MTICKALYFVFIESWLLIINFPLWSLLVRVTSRLFFSQKKIKLNEFCWIITMIANSGINLISEESIFKFVHILTVKQHILFSCHLSGCCLAFQRLPYSQQRRSFARPSINSVERLSSNLLYTKYLQQFAMEHRCTQFDSAQVVGWVCPCGLYYSKFEYTVMFLLK